ncbi:ATPase P-type K/Mg/Cd/Cu/Zn/Na/Ca/Na/H-transporter [Penicillium robsamsonii]|uniref:ATPase P-type K/Mg/Cd/Cu/Zn/Na/Ca/Na/H-transporter n=1 Tax=Penicillium robsamsonii TaxID=1792511 RepID=UPI002546A127|nr:ATPase P-type K/Mg/Cd/Cu/Zn/Na/Ca/Na/H-transporter [Penicillium robsamsonii]KAJ5834998.1 ATPase P-type K/Mg/Cd/Cu/Zn/Na/Ca/Na/H-transporter [Penicillium robsamsonii]
MSSGSKNQASDLEAGHQSLDTQTSLFFVTNVHCASCVAYITEVLSETPSVGNIEVTILTHEVRASHSTTVRPADLVNALIHAAFEVHYVTTFDQRGKLIAELDTSSWNYRGSTFFSSPRTSVSSISSNIKERIQYSSHKRHIANCDACRKEELEALSRHSSSRTELGLLEEKSSQAPFQPLNKHHERDITTTNLESTPENAVQESLRSFATSETKVQPGVAAPKLPTDIAELPSPITESADEFIAQISVGGMSCASCANSITAQVQQLEFVKEITVNLLTNSATVIYVGLRNNADEIVERINDAGFEASLDELNQLPKPPASAAPTASYVSEIAITGMTCGSCVGGVTRGLEELPFIRDVSVNLLSHSGRVEFEGRDNLDKIIEKIEDLGYDVTVNSVSPLKAGTENLSTAQIRTISIRVDGMFCHHCPQTVLGAVKSVPGVTIEEALSEKTPVLKVTYIPQPPLLTIRTIISAIHSMNDNFRATVYHPPSIEDRSRAIQHHERSRLLARLLFVFVSAIPTFLIGIVFMSLVSSENSVRMYLEQPMWSGSVTRIEWALFIITTPVMFYGTDVFHVRALKEVYALWRPGSRVPILRRFYRFGSMNLLISAGTSVAYISSLAVLIVDAVVGTKSSPHSTTYFDSVVFLTMFILAGRFLEAYSKARTGDAVTSLGKLRPSEALLFDDTSEDGLKRTSVDLLEVGDVVSIPHGTSPPADGVIVDSASYQFDESSLTGESRPVKKTVDDIVYTGSVNVGQPVRIRITELGGSSMLDRIIAVVREGQSKRAPLERVADLLTSHFVPIITLIAISTFIIWLALGHSGVLPADYLDVAHGGWTFWALEFAISVFVVACPCGLALAAPTALFVGGGLAAKHGILVKGGGEAFQEASRLNAIVFDKTGTLTEGGSLKVSDHEILTSDLEVVKVAWALARKMEESSNHPIAQAITEFCKTQQSSSVKSSDVHEISGQGMKGTFTVFGSEQERQYEAAIGNERLLKSLLSPETDTYFISNLLARYQSAGKSTAVLSLRQVHTQSTKPSNFIPAIIFATSDTIRPEAVEIISQLQKRQVDVFMCTGDNQTTAHAVADMIGIPRSKVMANVLPAEKASFVRQIQDRSPNTTPADGKTTIVAFVGDGVNDSPALAAADVSIAMASGSDVAINSASFILLNSDLSTILQLVLLSRRVFNRVRMNFGWAVIYNLCLVPVAAGVLYPIVSGHHEKSTDGGMIMASEHWRLSPVWAALAMALSSISVVLSSLALRIDKESIMKIVRRKK